MTSSNTKEQVYDSVMVLSKIYGSAIDHKRAEIYAEMLSGLLTYAELKSAIPLVVSKCKYFPSIAEIVAIARGTDTDRSMQVVGIIFNALREFGTYRVNDAKEAIPEVAWETVRIYGGWKELCLLETSQLGTARAQLRDIARSVLSKKDRDDGGVVTISYKQGETMSFDEIPQYAPLLD